MNFKKKVDEINLDLSIPINQSIYETNNFLINRNPTLIEYSTFFRSNKIVNFLLSREIKLTSSLWLYSIHGQNFELIQIPEQNKIEPHDKSYKECLIESIKCHHKEMSDYFIDKYNQKHEKDSEYDIFETSLKYYNFSFFPNDFKNKIIFYYLCKYDYSNIIHNLLTSSSFNAN